MNANPGCANVGSSSSGLEPSSSEMSADTVIYLGPCHNNNEETDGEHPPVILPNLSYKGNQCTVDMPENYPKPQSQPHTPRKSLPSSHSTPASPRIATVKPERAVFQPSPLPGPVAVVHGGGRQNRSVHSSPHHHQRSAPRGMIHADNIVMEQWVDGPKVSRSKISEARHLKREVNRNKNSETWIDGPRMEAAVTTAETKVQTPVHHQTRHQQPVEPGLQLPTLNQKQRGYGFMDTHKKSMIRKWVENQTTEVLKITTTSTTTTSSGKAAGEEWSIQEGTSQRRGSVSRGGTKTPSPDEDEDSGPSDVPPALPLIDKSSSKASEKDYGYTMNDYTAQHTVESGQHPLSALSFGNMSTVSSFHHFEEMRIQSGDQRANTK